MRKVTSPIALSGDRIELLRGGLRHIRDQALVYRTEPNQVCDTARKSRQPRLAKACVEACCVPGSTGPLEPSRIKFTSYRHSAASATN